LREDAGGAGDGTLIEHERFAACPIATCDGIMSNWNAFVCIADQPKKQ
jgi:hypothetical protein